MQQDDLSRVKGIAGVARHGQAKRALAAGDRAPGFVLPDTQGIFHSSDRMLGNGPLVIIFYRSASCTYCAADLRGIAAVAVKVRSLGATLVAVSDQSRSESRRFKRENGLGFPILSDVGGGIIQSFGLRCVRARFILAQDGVVVYADVDPVYTRRPDPADLLIPLRALKGGRHRTTAKG